MDGCVQWHAIKYEKDWLNRLFHGLNSFVRFEIHDARQTCISFLLLNSFDWCEVRWEWVFAVFIRVTYLVVRNIERGRGGANMIHTKKEKQLFPSVVCIFNDALWFCHVCMHGAALACINNHTNKSLPPAIRTKCSVNHHHHHHHRESIIRIFIQRPIYFYLFFPPFSLFFLIVLSQASHECEEEVCLTH